MEQIATPIASAAWRGRRLATVLGVIAVLGTLALAAFAPSLLSVGGLNHDIAIQIRRTTGLATRIRGTASFSLLPQPTVEITDVSLSDPSGALRIDADSLTGYLRLLPLLAGRFEIARASLLHPGIVIDLDGRPMTSDSAISRAAKSSDAETGEYTRLGFVDLVDGTARLESQSAHFDRLFEDVNLSIDWPNLGASAGLTGALTYRGEPIEISAWFAEPLALIRGSESTVTLDVKANVARLSTSGKFAAGPHLQYVGQIKAKIASLRGLAELTGHSFPHHGRFADLDLSCDASFMANTAALSNLQLRLDGNEYEGTLAIQNGGAKPLISGTLATNYLDLAPFLTGLPDPLTKEQGWNQSPLDAADLGFADLDLRVSATRLRLAQMELRDAALSLITHTGGMDLSLAEATANRGKVKGRVSLTVENGDLAVRATGSMKDFRLRPLPLNVNGHHELSGLLSATLALDSTGRSISDLMHKVAGRVQVDLDSGEITRLDLDSLLSLGSGGKQKTSATSEADASAPLDGASVGLKIADGRAEIENGRLQTKGINLVFGGSASVAERSLDLWALTQQPRAADATAPEEATRLGLTGSWDAPKLAVERLKPSRLPPQILPRNDTKPGNVLGYAPGGG